MTGLMQLNYHFAKILLCLLSWGVHGWDVIRYYPSHVYTFQESWSQLHSYVPIDVDTFNGKRSKRSSSQLSWFEY